MTPYRRKLALAILIWILGALPLGAVGFLLVTALVAPVHDFEAPGAIVVRLHEGDDKAILLHTRGSSLGRFSSQDVGPFDIICEARSGDGRWIVRPDEIDAYTITHGGDSYVAKLGFSAPGGGRYRVQCEPGRPDLEHIPLGLSAQAHLGRIFLLGFGALALCAATIMAGVIIARRARRAGPPGPEAPIRP